MWTPKVKMEDYSQWNSNKKSSFYLLLLELLDAQQPKSGGYHGNTVSVLFNAYLCDY